MAEHAPKPDERTVGEKIVDGLGEPDAKLQRTGLAILRRNVEAGVYDNVGPAEMEFVKKHLLKIIKETKNDRWRVAAIQTHVAMQRHNLNTLVWLTRIDRDQLGGNDDDIINLPDSGPWKQEASDAGTGGTNGADLKGDIAGSDVEP